MLCILKAIVGWAILSFIGINLTGVLLGGLADQIRLGAQSDTGSDYADAMKRSMRRKVAVFDSILAALGALYIYLLFHWWNWELALAGLMLMLVRIPEQIYEIHTGERVTRDNMPARGCVGQVTRILFWLSLPIVWLGLCRS